jgi:hypothetical protein
MLKVAYPHPPRLLSQSIALPSQPAGLPKQAARDLGFHRARGGNRIASTLGLFALGKSWADVRSVPDGALTNIPDGPDVVLLSGSVSPRPMPVNRSPCGTAIGFD